MTILLILAFAAPVATGWSVVSILGLEKRLWPERLLAAAIAVFLGFALHSLWCLAWLIGTDGWRSQPAFLLFDLSLAGASSALAVTLVRRRRARTNLLSVAASGSVWVAVGALLCGLGTVTAALSAEAQQHGAWDAWAVWNLKARWMALGGNEWSTFLTSPIFLSSHPDYPLLVPLSVSRVWMAIGDTRTVVSQIFGAESAGLTLILMFAGVWLLRGALAAVVATGTLLGFQQMIIVAASQYSDVPLAAAYLACTVALALGVHVGGMNRWFVVAGLSAGAALWTKNEGTPFVASVFASTAIMACLSRTGVRVCLARLTGLAAGLLPFFAASLYVKSVTPVNIFVSTQTSATLLGRLLDGSRHQAVFDYMLRMLGSLMDPIVIACFAAYLLLRGTARNLHGAWTVLLTMACTAVVYYVAFIVTPYPLDWHLRTAADRLVIQLWPAAVFALVLVTAGDDVALTSATAEATTAAT